MKGAQAFALGDLVMVAGKNNSANVSQKAKIMMKWQGPYQIVKQMSNSQFDVLLLDNPRGTEKPVHWTRLKRFGGSELGTVAELVKSAQHDQQKFYVEAFEDWCETGEANVELLQPTVTKSVCACPTSARVRASVSVRQSFDCSTSLFMWHHFLRSTSMHGRTSTSSGALWLEVPGFSEK